MKGLCRASQASSSGAVCRPGTPAFAAAAAVEWETSGSSAPAAQMQPCSKRTTRLLLKVLIRLLKARLKVLLEVLIKPPKARMKVLLKALIIREPLTRNSSQGIVFDIQRPSY